MAAFNQYLVNENILPLETGGILIFLAFKKLFVKHQYVLTLTF